MCVIPPVSAITHVNTAACSAACLLNEPYVVMTAMHSRIKSKQAAKTHETQGAINSAPYQMPHLHWYGLARLQYSI